MRTQFYIAVITWLMCIFLQLVWQHCAYNREHDYHTVYTIIHSTAQVHAAVSCISEEVEKGTRSVVKDDVLTSCCAYDYGVCRTDSRISKSLNAGTIGAVISGGKLYNPDVPNDTHQKRNGVLSSLPLNYSNTTIFGFLCKNHTNTLRHIQFGESRLVHSLLLSQHLKLLLALHMSLGKNKAKDLYTMRYRYSPWLKMVLTTLHGGMNKKYNKIKELHGTFALNRYGFYGNDMGMGLRSIILYR